ncbi:cupin domain-containing protein [Hydrogenothermus marinus]|uniref:Cupin domain-containing protein n=1 Tax=Hydrogenothermus marinus TaxID=133270 RepID=A0A3M0BL97_9AQUI|nr:cupin domain-containing protein [Hydrogenothermus marinus]RMA97937.1 Cupin domain-containing protein [Hydrogenothermus marinus]
MDVQVVKTGITDIEKIKDILKKEGYHSIYSWTDSPNTFYDWHTHNYEEVRWVYKGKVKIGYETGEVILEPGDMLIIKPKTKHWAETTEGVSYICGSK